MNATMRRSVAAALGDALDGGGRLVDVTLPREDARALQLLLADTPRLRAGVPAGEGRTPARPKKAATTIPKPIRDVVLARAQGRCEACGEVCFTPHLHHRKLRSQGGQHTPENLVCTHSGCHHLIHNVLPREDAERFGLIVPSWADPADIPVVAGLSTHVREDTCM